jgi:hypothetical protein
LASFNSSRNSESSRLYATLACSFEHLACVTRPRDMDPCLFEILIPRGKPCTD